LKMTLMGGESELQISTKTDVQTYELYLRARQLIHQRRLDSFQLAAQLLRQAINEDPGYAPAYAQLGIVTLLDSELNYGTTSAEQARETALPQIQQALDISPNLAEGWAGLGLYYLQLPGQADLAIEHLRKSLALNPNQIDPSNWLQTALTSQGEIAQSTRLLEQILDRDPLYRPAIFNLAVKYVLTNQLDKSEALIERSKRYLANDVGLARAEGLHYLLSQQPVEGYRIAKQNLELNPSDPGARVAFSIAQMQLYQDEAVAESGLGWAKCISLSRLKRVEEAENFCRNLLDTYGEQGIDLYFWFLVDNGREQVLLQYLEERWSDLDAFEKDFPSHDGFAWQTMGHIALAYRLVGNDAMYANAMQRFRANLDFQRTNGADSPLMELSEAYYFALAGDQDATLAHLERASAMGYKFSSNISSDWKIYKELDGHPRFEALKQDGVRRVNAAREELGLEPLKT
ncbi:MAG: hypothetical protein KJO85_09725, partial [Gammaproteobacteria bacterium]|nr:hypothetical protein [Gammaproteobacteria bacterium]